MIPYIISNTPGTYIDQSWLDIWKNGNGLGRLAECIKCSVTEGLNDEKTAVLRVPLNALHADKIARGGLLMFDDHEHKQQLWRIEGITKTYSNNIVDVRCNHISYDLNKLSCRPFNSTGVSNILNSMRTNYVSYIPFWFTSDVVNATAQIGIKVPTQYRDIIGGIDDNIIKAFPCEVDWDNLEVKFLQRRGTDTNITIRYGVNIIDAKQEESIEKYVDLVYGYVKKGDNPLVLGLPVSNPNSVGNYPLTLVADMTNTFSNTDTIDQNTIKNHTQAWVTKNKIFEPEINFTINYLSLKSVDPDKWQQLYDIHLGDTVSVYIPKYGTFTARVTEVVYDVLNNRIESIQVGVKKDTFAGTIESIRKDSATLNAYPVGAYYTSASNTNPSAIFGGEWSLESSTGTSYTFRRTN